MAQTVIFVSRATRNAWPLVASTVCGRVSLARLLNDDFIHPLTRLQLINSIDLVQNKNLPLLNQEIEFRKKLETLKRELEKPNQFHVSA